MTWLLLIPIIAVVVYLAVVGRRDRHDLAPLPPVTDTARRGFDQGRLTGAPFDQDDDGPDAA